MKTMALKSEFSTTCPCCQATLVVDVNLRRIVRHEEPVRGDRPELSDAQRILAEEAARREAIFQESVSAEKNRGDALSKRFEEALRQAREEPITRPARDFDLD
jgi:GTP cyclohydrolase FolE2